MPEKKGFFGKLKDKLKSTFSKGKEKLSRSKGDVFDEYGRRKEYITGDKVAKSSRIKLTTKYTADYNIYKDIKDCPLYTKSEKDSVARDYIEESVGNASPNKILPGQLILFNYFEPKTKEELEYYDASPCTIFFNVIATEGGKRILGFNLHYFPSKIRFNIIKEIFNHYKAMYGKSFTEVSKKAAESFDYKTLIKMLDDNGAAFGVREYIPALCKDVRPIPPNMWKVAVYTEGWFKKRTREQIMKFWQNFVHGEGTPKERAERAAKATNKTKKSKKK